MIEYDFSHRPGSNALPMSLGLSALSFLNQVSDDEAARIEKSLSRLSDNYELLSRTTAVRLTSMKDAYGHKIYTYRAALNVRAFFFVDKNEIHVVDIIRRSQLDRLKGFGGVTE